MNPSKKLLLCILFSCLLSSTITFTAITIYANNRANHPHRDPTVTANVYFIYETTSCKHSQSGNLITNIGERLTRNILGFDNVTGHNATKWIALGNSSISASKTKLDTEATTAGFTRALSTVSAWMNGTDYAVNFTKKFTATGTLRLNATALHWNPTSNSDGNCFALASLDPILTWQATWNCTITWVITWDAN